VLRSCFAITRANLKLLTGWTTVKQLFGDNEFPSSDKQVNDVRIPLYPLGKEVQLFSFISKRPPDRYKTVSDFRCEFHDQNHLESYDS